MPKTKTPEPPETEYGIVTYLRIPPELRQEIEEIARREDRQLTTQIVRLLRSAVEQEKKVMKAA